MKIEEMLIVTLFLGLVWGFSVDFLVSNLRYHWHKFKFKRYNNNLIKQKKKEVEEMKARGEMHEWMFFKTMSGEKLVCKKTGYCPEIDGFFMKEDIDRYLMSQEIAKQQQERYDRYRHEELQKLSDKKDLPLDVIEDIIDEGYKIKKDFHLKLIEEQQAQLEEQIERIRNSLAQEKMDGENRI